MARLRILLFIHSFEPGGVEISALRMAETWHRAGYSVRVVVGCNRGVLNKTLGHEICTVLPPPRRMTAWFETIRMVRHLPEQIRKFRPDIIFCPGNRYAIVAVLVRMLLGLRCPPIVLKVSNDLERRDMSAPVRAGYHVWLRAQGALLDHFVGLSQATRSEIERHTGVPRDRVSIVEDAAIADRNILEMRRLRTSTHVRGDFRHFLAIGRLVPQKNYIELIRGFATGARFADRLTILGEGPLRKRLEREVRKHGLTERVQLPGFADPAAFLAAADCFVLASKYEGIPAVVIEALAAGIPIIATACSIGLPDLLNGGEFGTLLFDDGAATLSRAIRDADLSDRYGERQAARARDHSVEIAAASYIDLFKDILSQRAAASGVSFKDPMHQDRLASDADAVRELLRKFDEESGASFAPPQVQACR